MITQTSHVERVLIVLNADGSLKGAHQESMTEIKDGDTLLSSRQEMPVPLNAAALAAALPSQAALVAQVQALTDAAATLTSERDAALAAKAAAEQDAAAKATQIAALEARIAELTAPPAPPAVDPMVIPSRTYIERFTPEERAAIYTAARDNPTLFDYLLRTAAAPEIHLDNAEVTGALDMLTAARLIAPGRKAQILAPAS